MTTPKLTETARTGISRWECATGCPRADAVPVTAPREVRARAARHAQRTGHPVTITHEIRITYVHEGEGT